MSIIIFLIYWSFIIIAIILKDFLIRCKKKEGTVNGVNRRPSPSPSPALL